MSTTWLCGSVELVKERFRGKLAGVPVGVAPVASYIRLWVHWEAISGEFLFVDFESQSVLEYILVSQAPFPPTCNVCFALCIHWHSSHLGQPVTSHKEHALMWHELFFSDIHEVKGETQCCFLYCLCTQRGNVLYTVW